MNHDRVKSHGASRMSSTGRLKGIVFFALALLLGMASFLRAEELSDRQKILADRYTQLEQVLMRMSEATAATNPRRAELLRKVLLESKDKLVGMRLEEIVRTLELQRLTEAIDGQENVEKDLLELLRLLENENREQRRDAEKETIKQFLRDLEEIIHQEKSLKAKTAQREDDKLGPLDQEQRDVRVQTQALRDRIAESENPDAAPKTDEAASEEKTDGEKTDGEKTDGEKTEGEKTDGEKTENNDDESGDENESRSPTQQAMKKALQRMQQAEKKLQKAEKGGALEDQEEAIAELQRVKAELEKILRQIREEELMQTLERLEARFKRMLKIEQAIRTQTEKLATDVKNTEDADSRQIRIQAGRVAADQVSVIEDADAALVLLRADGTAQAMVESLLQTRFDMGEVQSRLDRAELDSVTLDVEDTIIASLQEMLEAVENAIKESQERMENVENPPPPGTEGEGEQEEPLIQLLAELKMIRSMQRRVNERTERYEKEIDRLKSEPEPDMNVLRAKVEELARQQNRISRILHDLRVGRTE